MAKYTYKPYEETERSKEYSQKLAQQETNKPADWTGGTYGESVKQALDKVMNRDKFTYDLNGDMLYKQYKDQYQLLGQQAMMDTIGQASALTGGYGNSYAQNVGQQAYQGYLQKLNDIVPQLYGMAYDRYNAEGQDLKDQYAMLAQAEENEYGRYRDRLADYQNERNYLADMYNNERNFGYNQYADDRNFDYGAYVDDRNYEYQLGRDAVADDQWNRNFNEGIRQYEQNFNYGKERDAAADAQWQANFDEGVRQYEQNFAYGKERDAVADAQWQANFDEALRQYNENMALQRAKLAGSGSGGGSHTSLTKDEQKKLDSERANFSGEGYDNWKLSKSQLDELQEYYGINPNGKWDAYSVNKSGGKSAADAWAEYQNSADYKAQNGAYTEFDGNTYEDAISFLNMYGDNSSKNGLLSKSEWNAERLNQKSRERNAKEKGSIVNSGEEYSFDTYADYLKWYIYNNT